MTRFIPYSRPVLFCENGGETRVVPQPPQRGYRWSFVRNNIETIIPLPLHMATTALPR